jgi:hypothetical protein
VGGHVGIGRFHYERVVSFVTAEDTLGVFCCDKGYFIIDVGFFVGFPTTP